MTAQLPGPLRLSIARLWHAYVAGHLTHREYILLMRLRTRQARR